MLDGADHVFTNIAREPLVHRVHLGAEALEFIDRHGSNLEQAVSHEVLDPLLGGDELLPERAAAGRVLERPLSHEIEQGALGPCDGGAEGLHDLLGLLHRRRGRHLVGGRRVDREEVGLEEGFVQRLRPASGDNDVLLVDEALLHPAFLEMTASCRLVRDVD